jgi:MerR family transcriptional regulator, light-induced transcriptional regulator
MDTYGRRTLSSSMTRKARPARYPIRTAARLTGLGIDTLRAWERRHEAVTPERDPRGRMYTDADVRRLQLLRRAVERGHTIGRASKLQNVELEALCASLEPIAATAVQPAPPGAIPGDDRAAMLDAAVRFDQAALVTALGRAAALLKPSQFVSEVALPFLNDVNERTRLERKDKSAGRLAASVVRNILGMLLHQHAGGGGARVLFASLEGVTDELGALIAALLAASGGLDAVYLGTGVPAGDVVTAATLAEADVVVVNVGEPTSPDVAIRELTTLVRGLSPDIEIWVKGGDAHAIAARIGARVEAVETLSDLTSQLIRIGARIA